MMNIARSQRDKMKKDSGYLFVTFSGEGKNGEEIYFSLSRDGLHWKDLNSGKSVLHSEIGETGVRDPFLFEMVEKYYLIATDLKIGSGTSWEDAAQKGSLSVIIWESKDLIHWSEERKCEIGSSDAGCVWAPEAVYDPKKEAAMVFWSSNIAGKYKINRSYTKDFVTFTEAEVYMELEHDVIDMTIWREKDTFYRFYKNEENKTICVDRGQELDGEFQMIYSEFLHNLKGVEGPIVFRLKDRKLCLMVDQFQINGGYLPVICKDLDEGLFYQMKQGEYCLGNICKRHGSIMEISDKTYLELEKYYKA